MKINHISNIDMVPLRETVLRRRLHRQSVFTALDVRESDKGLAVHAARQFQPGDVLIKLGGRISANPTQTTIQIGENEHIVSWMGGHINHSCEPSGYLNFEDLTLRALSRLGEGDEITRHYMTTEWDMPEPFDCKCGSKRCMGRIRGFKHLSLQQKMALETLLSPYLREKLEEAEDLCCDGFMTIKEFVSKHIDCSRCTRSCCNGIDETAFLGTDENVPRDNMNEENTFFSAENERCVYFDGKFCSIYGNGIRPFLCKVYPFRVAGGKLFVDDWCMYGKELAAAVAENDRELIRDLRSLRNWLADNVPSQLARFWDSRREDKSLEGTELSIGIELDI
jgi:Fe-S-cluster containining protein